MAAYTAKVTKKPKVQNFQQFKPGYSLVKTAGGVAQVPAVRPQYNPAADPTYLAQEAQRNFQATQKLGELDESERIDKRDFGVALERMAEQEGQARTNTTQSANRSGLFYSGILGKQLGELSKRYAQQREDSRVNLEDRDRARLAAREAIQRGAPIDQAVALAAAADRRMSWDTGLADAGVLAPAWQAPSEPALRAGGGQQKTTGSAKRKKKRKR